MKNTHEVQNGMKFIRNDSDLLDIYYRNPVAFSEIISLDLFRRKVALGNTVFEEVELFDPFEEIIEMFDSNGSESSSLRNAIQKLFIQAHQDDDRASPLLSFFLLMYKRVQVLDKVQEFQNIKLEDVKKLKTKFESMSLYSRISPREEVITFHKNLQKAMSRSDFKKGLFSKFRKSRSEAVYKLLSKSAQPLSLLGIDMTNVRDYLVQYGISNNVQRRRRFRSLSSLILLALSQGSLNDMLLVLHSILSFSNSKQLLSLDTSEEGGILLRFEVLRALHRFRTLITDSLPKHDTAPLEDKRFDPINILENPHHILPTNIKKPVSVRCLFIFILAHIDLLVTSYLNGPGLLYRKSNTLSIHFVVETLPKTFENLISLLDRLLNLPIESEDVDCVNTRTYAAVASLRLLRLNIEALYLWKRDNERLENLATRTALDSKEQNENYLLKLKDYLLKILEDEKLELISKIPTKKSPKTVQIIKSNSKDHIVSYNTGVKTEEIIDIKKQSHQKGKQQLVRQSSGFIDDDVLSEKLIIHEYMESDDFVLVNSAPTGLVSNYPISQKEMQQVGKEIASIICTGFTIFYPTHKEQVEFILDALKSLQKPLKRIILQKLLQKIVNDTTMFDEFMVKGLGTKEQALVFIEKIIGFLKNHTIYEIGTLVTKQERSPITHEISMLLLKILLMWQNQLFSTVTSVDVRYRTSTLPRISLKVGEGRTLFEYSSKIFQACSELLLESNTTINQLDDKNSKESLQFIDQSLHDSIVGYLLFPLLQGYIKLLWRISSSSSDMENLKKMTSFLIPYVSELLRSVNALNRLLFITDKPFEWFIAETDHPYEFNLNEHARVVFDEKALFVTIKFDPRCRTSSHEDNLQINSDDPSSQPLQVSGQGNTIPINPLLTWGNSMNLRFTSEQKLSDWGIKCSVIPIFDQKWLYELEQYLGWLGGRCATYLLSAFPYNQKEKKYSKWLNSRLFINGLEISERELVKNINVDHMNQKTIASFLNDLIIVDGTAGELVNFMYEHLKAESMMLRDNTFVIHAERAIIAVMLKHLNLVGIAIRFANVIEKAKSENRNLMDLKDQVPYEIVYVWRTARRIRSWMVQQRQQQQLDYERIHDLVFTKAKFLLGLQSATFSHILLDRNAISEKLGQTTIEEPTIKFEEKRKDIFESFRICINVWKCFRKWKRMVVQEETRDEEEEKENMRIICESILKFVQSKVVTSELQSLMEMRKERALSRGKAFKLFTDLLEFTNFYTIKGIIIHGIRDVLMSKSMKHDDRIDFHYFNNIEGCGLIYAQILNESFKKFLIALFDNIDMSDNEVLFSGLMRQILETCFIAFKPCDVEWVLELKFLQKLCPVMYNTSMKDKSEEHLKFKLKSSLIEEKKEANKRAWKIFRLLSVRCVEMLEDWDNVQYTVPMTKRKKIRLNLNQLRDNIFEFLFEELEVMVRQDAIIPDILEEILSLMVSLCNTESAQICLSTKRFQKLLLPFLKLGIYQIQELALQLCKYLILAENVSVADLAENTILLEVLFEFLGSYEMNQVSGHTKIENSTSIGLTMAKDIFVLIRRLFKDTSPVQWRNIIQSMMERALNNTIVLLDEFIKVMISSKAGDGEIIRNQLMEAFKHVFAAFTILNGFSYIPREGEPVKVLLNDHWTDAKVVHIEEHCHKMQIATKALNGYGEPQQVSSECVKVLTQEPLSDDYEVNDTTVKSICDFIVICGKLIMNQDKMSILDDHIKLLFMNLWTRGLKTINLWIDDSKKLPIIIDDGRLLSLQSFIKIETGIMYGKRLKLDACTYTFTGKQFTRQFYFSCLTCGMSNTRAVCAFCARTCHRGHRLGPAEIGEFYCDCGAGEGKFPCKALKRGPPDELPTLERMESLSLRVQKLMPLYASLRNQQNSLNVHTFPSKFILRGHNTGYSIDHHTNEISFAPPANGYSMICTDYPVLDMLQVFYFEISIQSIPENGSILIGFTNSINVNVESMNSFKDTYMFDITKNMLLKDSTVIKEGFGKKISKSDIIGCGLCKRTKSIFFTINGEHLGDAFTNVQFKGYPFIMLHGDKISVVPNLGGKLFYFNLPKLYIQNLGINESVQLYKRLEHDNSRLQFELRSYMIEELSSLGFSLNECEEAYNKYPHDINAAASWLYKSKSRPVRQELADQLHVMGFDRRLCVEALKLSGDDINLALNWLLDGNYPQMEDESDSLEDDEDRGSAFLGAEISNRELKHLLKIGMLQEPNTEMNENLFSDIQIQKLKNGDLIVVNPYLKDETNNTNLLRVKGQLGVVERKMLNGAYIQSVDSMTGQYVTAFVTSPNLLTPPKELQNLQISNLFKFGIQSYKAIGTLYCRRIMTKIFTNFPPKLPISSIGTDPKSIYQSLKILFVSQYQDQEHNFCASEPKLTHDLESMIQSMKNTIVIQNEKEIPIFDILVQEALKDINHYSESKPNFRKIAFKSELNNQKIRVKFWNATSLCITFSDKCELSTQTDVLAFYYDAEGRRIARYFKGPMILPRRIVIAVDQFWFEFKTSSLREGSGFQFYISPTTSKFTEETAIRQPNLALATLILKNASNDLWRNNKMLAVETFEDGLKYLMSPFAPFKGTLSDAMCTITLEARKFPQNQLPKLNLLKKFRLELEDLYDEFLRHSEAYPTALPVFHRLIDFMSIIRSCLKSDLCSNLFLTPEVQKKTHFYSFQETGRHIQACTSCVKVLQPKNIPKYHIQDERRCQCNSASHLTWVTTNESENLVPIHSLHVNPSDWFEHVQWIDQLAIVRQLALCFLQDLELPDWVIFEAALETKKKVFYKESPHPYHVVNDSGYVHITGAKTLFISFDKHSKTHRCDRLFFSSKFRGDDLGSYGGDELKDKTIVVHGDTVYYQFLAVGGDHECSCNNCGCRINGVRYHCTECDDYDLCERCIKKPRIHNDTHLFLKIRRPVDCVPAVLPHLYTNRWINTAQFRGNIHVGVRCNECGVNPIRGIRYWCENCEDFNLCEKCAEEEYKYHDRMHVFLRVVRPLPPKNQLPPNALPYGLVYEKDLDTHWGYLFSVSSSDSCMTYNDPQIQTLMKDIKQCMVGWNKEKDMELVQYVENHCNGWQSLEWNGLCPTPNQLLNYPRLAKQTLKSTRFRFIILKLLNRKISRVLHLLNLEDVRTNFNNLGSLIANLRERIFHSVKMDVWNHTLTKSLVEMNPISLKLNRQRAAEENLNVELKAKNSLFNQAFEQVQGMSPRILSRKGGAWKVTFLGESADDYGGPFRESITQMCSELETDQLQLFINVPNAQHSIGQNREKFMPNPHTNSARDMQWYRFVGVLMGIGLLSKNVLPLDFSSQFWKIVVKQQDGLEDLEAIDQLIVQSMRELKDIDKKNVNAENFDKVIFETFTTLSASGERVELIPNGSEKKVTFENRHQYIDLVLNYRLNETRKQMEAIRDGLYSIISPRFISIFSWNEMEMLICGTPVIDIETLKKHTIYEGYTVNSREIKDFWSILESFSPTERSLYLRFVWGRSRLPITEEGFTHPMKIQRLERAQPDKYLPLSHTCFFSIELPPYSSKRIMREKLLYAITHCKAIDTDFTTVATEARNLAF